MWAWAVLGRGLACTVPGGRSLPSKELLGAPQRLLTPCAPLTAAACRSFNFSFTREQ